MKQMSNTRTVWLGIDPGKDGALAAISGDETLVVPFSEDSFASVLSRYSPSEDLRVRCVLEHVGAMPGQGSVSMFHFGENFGFIRGLLKAYAVPYELVRPQKWKKVFSCTSDKNTSIAVAKNLFPYVDLRRTPRCTKPHDGTAEALLMAEYARRTLG